MFCNYMHGRADNNLYQDWLYFDSTTRQAALQVQKILAQWHTCQPHTIRLATLVAYSSSGVKLICVDIVLLQGIYYTVKVIKCTA